MHSSRMRTARSLTVFPYLVVSHACPPLEATTHTPPEQPHMPPPCSNHTHPPRATMHAPQSNHACPPSRATTHAPPEQPHMPPMPPQKQPRMPPQSNHACPPPVNRITDRCKNITFANYVCGRQ